MFTNVVIGIDGFRPDARAIKAAQAVAPSAAYHLVAVYPDSDQQPSAGFEDYRERVRQAALEFVEEQRAAAELPGAEMHALPGHTPSRALKAFAADISADLIVLGGAAESALNRLVMGDVARSVLHGAPCPVLVVARCGESPARPNAIGVAYDGSAESDAALRLAVELAKGLDARIEVVEGIPIGNPRTWGPKGMEHFGELIAPEQERITAKVQALDVPATATVVPMTGREALKELAGRVDLVVCGSRSTGPARRIAFGSTADDLIHHATCPVLVVPRGVEV